MKLSHSFTQVLQVIGLSLFVCSLSNGAFAFDVIKAEQEAKKQAETTVRKPHTHPDGCKHHCKDEDHHSTGHPKTDDKPPVKMK